MNRRPVLAGAAALLSLSLAGCVGSGDPPGQSETDERPSGTETPTDGTLPDGGGSGTHPRFTESSLTHRDECPAPGDADVSFDESGVTVVGCVVGKNGCTVPSLEHVSYDGRTETVTLVVAAVEERDENQACTEALVHLGYEARVELDGTVPDAAVVVHDDVNGRREVVHEER